MGGILILSHPRLSPLPVSKPAKAAPNPDIVPRNPDKGVGTAAVPVPMAS